jgi:hypothetical protein
MHSNEVVKLCNVAISFNIEMSKNHRKNIQKTDFEMINCGVTVWNFFGRFLVDFAFIFEGIALFQANEKLATQVDALLNYKT